MGTSQGSFQPGAGNPSPRALPSFLHASTTDAPFASKTTGRPVPAFVADLLIATALAVAAFLLYLPTLSAGFLDYDDPIFVNNPLVKRGLTLRNIQWAITTGSVDWLPMVWLSHMAIVSIFGPAPAWHHAVNVALHALNVVLVFLVLRSMTGRRWPAAMVAALFAFHPLHVESVAWVAERKDVLSGAFFLLTLLAYAGYVRRPGALRYGLVLVFYAAALMSKSMVVTLPFLLPLLDIWPLNRGRWTLRTLAEKIPLFLLAGSTSAITFLTVRREQSTKGQHYWSFAQRAANADVSVARYLGKLVWPAKLSAFYTYPQGAWPTWLIIASAALIAIITLLAWRLRKAMPFVLIGWLWFMGMLAPVCGLVPVGLHAMADRYMYLPSIGLFIAIVWVAADLAGRHPAAIKVLAPASVLLLAALAATSWRREAAWGSTFDLFADALAVDEQNWKAHDYVGEGLLKQGDVAGAMSHFQRSAELNPRYPLPFIHMGMVLRRTRQTDQSLALFRKAVDLAPELPVAHQWLGIGLTMESDFAGADREFAQATRLAPDDPTIPAAWALSMAGRGQLDRAKQLAQSALDIDPTDTFAIDAMKRVNRRDHQQPLSSQKPEGSQP
jgi:Flp pilus assembly protein TadD